MELSERIALARRQAGLSQEQLGEKLGVSRQAVSKWESGQSNPDVAYIAEMCRLFGISSDWLLLGREQEQASVPARCPSCQAVVTGLDNFCPNCGRPLQDGPCTYTLVVNCGEYPSFRAAEDLRTLAGYHLLPKDCPVTQGQSDEQLMALLQANPCLTLARGLSKEQAERIMEKLSPSAADAFRFYRDSGAGQAGDVSGAQPVSPDELRGPKSLSFGTVVLAVIVGVICAILLLSFL